MYKNIDILFALWVQEFQLYLYFSSFITYILFIYFLTQFTFSLCAGSKRGIKVVLSHIDGGFKCGFNNVGGVSVIFIF